jgi:hypothetical protein
MPKIVDTRATLLAQAAKLTGKFGSTNLTRRMVAKAAGVSDGLVTHHLGNVEEMRKLAKREAKRLNIVEPDKAKQEAIGVKLRAHGPREATRKAAAKRETIAVKKSAATKKSPAKVSKVAAKKSVAVAKKATAPAKPSRSRAVAKRASPVDTLYVAASSLPVEVPPPRIQVDGANAKPVSAARAPKAPPIPVPIPTPPQVSVVSGEVQH